MEGKAEEYVIIGRGIGGCGSVRVLRRVLVLSCCSKKIGREQGISDESAALGRSVCVL